MICVAQQPLDRQLKLFIDYSKLNITAYGNILKIQKYFISQNIFFDPNQTDLFNSGWDYIVSDDYVYFVVDTDWQFSNLLAPVFLFYNEVKTVVDLVNHIKQWVRNDKLNKLI